MLTTPEGRITDFVEKPTLTELREAFPVPTEEEFERLPLLTNAGMYLTETLQARKLAGDPDLQTLRQRRLDFGMDLLPWLVGSGYPVHAHAIARVGDLGTVADYLQTMIDVLNGAFASVSALMGEPYDRERRIWIPPDTLQMRDEASGKSLEEKLEEGLVEIGGNVRLGRYVVVAPGVHLQDCNVDDGVEIGEGVDLRRSAVRDGAMIGPGAAVSDCYLGSMVEVRSRADRRTVLEQHVAIGDEVVLQEGVSLSGNVSVWPRVKIPAGVRIPPGTEVRDSNDVLRYL
jgi:NDP-sugar pyrophosphorylase family protein